MNKELNETAAKGFRLIPSTLLSKKAFMGSVEILVVMKRQAEDGGSPCTVFDEPKED
jgi:hypothetical protein